MMSMDHTAVLSDFGKLVIRTSKPKEGKIVLRLIRFTGKALADIRKEHGLKQAEAAKSLGISQSLISLFENEVQDPNREQLIAIQDFFSALAGHKVIFYFDKSPDSATKDPDEYWGQKS